MKRVAIIGSGDLGQQIAYHIKTDNQFEVAGFFDDYREPGILVNGYSILGGIDKIHQSFNHNDFDELFIAIGYKHIQIRAAIYERLKGKVPFATFVHSSCIIDRTAVIAEGVCVYPGCIIDQGVKIEENVLINVGCCIAHHTVIGQHTFLSPRVAIAGFVKIGSKNIIGINATIIDNITTADGVQLGGGTVVIKSIDNSGLYVGNPARFVR
jgi:sugar O-acyltransferase (sialic acid O-acetyltransferase NeuD family)